MVNMCHKREGFCETRFIGIPQIKTSIHQIYSLQRLSVVVQRGNAISVAGSAECFFGIHFMYSIKIWYQQRFVCYLCICFICAFIQREEKEEKSRHAAAKKR